MPHKRTITGILIVILFPSILTFFYFFQLADQSSLLQQMVYGIGKTIQFTLPLWWVAWVLRKKIKFKFKLTWGWVMGLGILFAVLEYGLMTSLLNSELISSEILFDLKAKIQVKIAGMGIKSVSAYIILGTFYSLIHSLLEEYYWRWFVYGQLRESLKPLWANLISSTGFMLHHIIVLAVFFGWSNPLTYLLSLGVGIGGVFWAWQYEKNQSLWAPWISHMLVDAGIFWVGYTLIF